MRILLTGFRPFGGHMLNPTEWLMANPPPPPVGADVSVLLLDVVYSSAAAALRGAVDTLRPDAVIAFGLDASARGIRLERTARNLDNSAAPDNSGEIRDRHSPIRPGLPATLASTLPLDAIASRLEAAGLPSETSDDAGGYLCNHIFYQARALAEESPRPFLAGFVHVPPFAALSPADLREAARIIVAATVDFRNSSPLEKSGQSFNHEWHE